MGFYYQQPNGFYYNQPKGFYYEQKPGFYYNQKPQGFYYNKPQGFYYNEEPKQGFYYNQQPKQGFYYNQPQEGFYYQQPKVRKKSILFLFVKKRPFWESLYSEKVKNIDIEAWNFFREFLKEKNFLPLRKENLEVLTCEFTKIDRNFWDSKNRVW